MLYSEYLQRFDYLYYWFNLCCQIEIRDEKKYYAKCQKKLEEEKQKREGNEHTIESLEQALRSSKNIIDELPGKYSKSIQHLENKFEVITNNLRILYSQCILDHKDPTAIYERGKIHFDHGETIAFVDDIFTLTELGYTPTPEMNVELCRAYNDANLYNHAIKVLSETILKNPDMEEAYFERAVAYFETGNLQLALSDYLNFGCRPHFLNDPNYQHFVFSLGVGLGCLKGGADSAIYFVPSLFSTIYGLGKGIWSLASNPIGISKELIEETIACINYIKCNLTPELLAQLVPELKECIQKWDQIEEETKGYYVGYVLGRYGVDALICGGTTRAIQLYRNVKRANALLTLETAVASPSNAETFAKASEEFFILREEFKKKCKLHVGQQEKHIPGANNFQGGKGELTISVEHLEEIVSSKLGEGVPSKFSFGEAGYKELVEFDEIIGIHVDRHTKIRTETSIGEIHYNQEGGYHVVPVDPNKLQRLLDKNKKS